MEENKRVILTGIVIVILIGAALAIYFLFVEKTKGVAPAKKVSEKPAVEVPLEESLKAREEALKEASQVELDQSDDVVRKLAMDLSAHPQLASWLKTNDLIRKFTAAVDNIAHGLSPRPQIEFFYPPGDFKVIKKGRSYYLDPQSYHRYDQVADVFLSLDTDYCLTLYRQLKPLIQAAYSDLGYPHQDFQPTLIRAIAELLKVPIVEGDILLKKKVVTYQMADPRLESLSEAQKHLLRMGPENVRIIQGKLHELASGLGIPAERLPRSKIY